MPHKGGLYAQCHFCRRESKRQSHVRNREHNNQRTRRWADEHREEVREQGRAYASEHREEARNRTKIWYAANRDRKRATNKAWYWRDPEKRRAKNREYYQNNSDAVRLKVKTYRANHKDDHNRWNRDWEKRNPEYARAHAARRRALKRNAPGKYTQQDIELQYRSQHGLCWWCGKPVGDEYHIDHVIPLKRGGTNDPRNIVISCPVCNLSKGVKLPNEWNGRLL